MNDFFRLPEIADANALAAELVALEEFEDASSGALDPALFPLDEDALSS